MSPIMNKILKFAPTVARIFFGLQFVVAGANGFFNFMPLPELPAAAGDFMMALSATGYMMPVIKGIEIVAGLMLLANWRTPLALLLLAPIIVNIALFHTFLAPAFTTVAMLVGLESYLAWHHRESFAPLLRGSNTAQERARAARISAGPVHA